MRREPTVVCWILLGTLGGLAGCAAEAVPPSPEVAEEERVREVIDRFFVLAEKQDWDGVGRLMSEDFALYTDGAAVFGKRAYIDLLKADDLSVESWKLDDLQLKLSADRRTAWSRYRGVFATTSHGRRHDVQTAETLILAKEGDEWRIVHAHASVKSADPPATE